MAPAGAHNNVEVTSAPFDGKCSVRLAGLMPLLSYVLCSSTRTYMQKNAPPAFGEKKLQVPQSTSVYSFGKIMMMMMMMMMTRMQ